MATIHKETRIVKHDKEDKVIKKVKLCSKQEVMIHYTDTRNDNNDIGLVHGKRRHSRRGSASSINSPPPSSAFQQMKDVQETLLRSHPAFQSNLYTILFDYYYNQRQKHHVATDGDGNNNKTELLLLAFMAGAAILEQEYRNIEVTNLFKTERCYDLSELMNNSNDNDVPQEEEEDTKRRKMSVASEKDETADDTGSGFIYKNISFSEHDSEEEEEDDAKLLSREDSCPEQVMETLQVLMDNLNESRERYDTLWEENEVNRSTIIELRQKLEEIEASNEGDNSKKYHTDEKVSTDDKPNMDIEYIMKNQVQKKDDRILHLTSENETLRLDLLKILKELDTVKRQQLKQQDELQELRDTNEQLLAAKQQLQEPREKEDKTCDKDEDFKEEICNKTVSEGNDATLRNDCIEQLTVSAMNDDDSISDGYSSGYTSASSEPASHPSSSNRHRKLWEMFVKNFHDEGDDDSYNGDSPPHVQGKLKLSDALHEAIDDNKGIQKENVVIHDAESNEYQQTKSALSEQEQENLRETRSLVGERKSLSAFGESFYYRQRHSTTGNLDTTGVSSNMQGSQKETQSSLNGESNEEAPPLQKTQLPKPVPDDTPPSNQQPQAVSVQTEARNETLPPLRNRNSPPSSSSVQPQEPQGDQCSCSPSLSASDNLSLVKLISTVVSGRSATLNTCAGQESQQAAARHTSSTTPPSSVRPEMPQSTNLGGSATSHHRQGTIPPLVKPLPLPPPPPQQQQRRAVTNSSFGKVPPRRPTKDIGIERSFGNPRKERIPARRPSKGILSEVKRKSYGNIRKERVPSSKTTTIKPTLQQQVKRQEEQLMYIGRKLQEEQKQQEHWKEIKRRQTTMKTKSPLSLSSS